MTERPAWQVLPEHDLVPYRPLALDGLGALLVLAPHPDDEVFGVGGLLALAAQQGLRVAVVIVSDGAAGGDAAVRETEVRAAAAALGGAVHAGTLQFWRLPDRGVVPDAALVERIARAARGHGADWVLAPSPFEVHPDHRAVCAAAVAALRDGPRLGFYEVGQPLLPNALVDITPVLAAKRRAMRCFASQLVVQAYDEQVEALNRYRAYTLGPRVTHAEALWFPEPAELAGGIDGVLGAAARLLARRFAAAPDGPAAPSGMIAP